MTGHQNLGDASETTWVRQQIMVTLREISGNQPVQGVTSLAKGADQEFAHALLTLNWGFVVIIPCQRYETTFETEADLASYHVLLGKADRVQTLTYPEPSQDAFFAAGTKIVDEADYMIAVWDGRPARGRGGTGDIVEYASAQGVPLTHINPITREVHERRSHGGEETGIH